ncbi:hypothetical protein FSARC_14793 [Fusarium sarcochroum]|uniref:Ecp2 effector protein domain-containing protein n=1 Tax=Fusarium sarcochroum TaxID=1208366 RepID=A0A8H4SQX0_9HYPO|nr:hypothetical protein FSARC_14793 [Fusarium sarcochroum]
MHSFITLAALCTALAAALPSGSSPAGFVTRADPVLGDATCPDGDKFDLNFDNSQYGAAVFSKWVDEGADGLIDLSGNFKGQLFKAYNGITFFACDYKSGDKGSFINGNLVSRVLGGDEYLDTKCGRGRGGYERSNDLVIGRTWGGLQHRVEVTWSPKTYPSRAKENYMNITISLRTGSL